MGEGRRKEGEEEEMEGVEEVVREGRDKERE